MVDDAELLRRYSESGDDPAFTELVRRHINLVYFTALRRTRNAALAQDIAQSVFATVACKANRLARHASIMGWIYTTTRNLSYRAIRKEQTRRRYEQVAAMDTPTTADPTIEWERLRPIIDEVLEQLSPLDRDAILMRFFQGGSYGDLGAALRISEDAARMRIERALEKMRRLLQRRGIRSASATITAALSAQGALAVPSGMAAVVSSTAIAAATGASGTIAFLAFMSPMKIATAASIAATFATGVALFERSRAHSAENQLAAMTQSHVSLQSSLARAESQLFQARTRADEADRDTASLLEAVEIAQHQALQQKRPLVAQSPPKADDPLSRSLDAIFPNGIVATVGDKTITVAEIREKIAYRLPKIQAEARDLDEFGHRLNELQNAAIKDAVDRILLIKEFRNGNTTETPRQIPSAWVDRQIAEILNAKFGNDGTKLDAYLESRGVTPEQYRHEVEETIAYGYMRQQQRKMGKDANQAKAR